MVPKVGKGTMARRAGTLMIMMTNIDNNVEVQSPLFVQESPVGQQAFSSHPLPLNLTNCQLTFFKKN